MHKRKQSTSKSASVQSELAATGMDVLEAGAGSATDGKTTIFTCGSQPIYTGKTSNHGPDVTISCDWLGKTDAFQCVRKS